MDDQYQRFSGYRNGYGQADIFASDAPPERWYGGQPDDFWPYGPIGPGGAPLFAQQAPIYEGPYTGWGWGFGASLRGYGPGYAATGMGSGPARIGGFAPGSDVEYGTLDGQGYMSGNAAAFGPPRGQGVAPSLAPGYGPGYGRRYGPGYAPSAYQPTPPPGPFAPPAFAQSTFGNQGYLAPSFSMPGPFAPPPFVRVTGYVVVPGFPQAPQSPTPTTAQAGPGTYVTARPAGQSPAQAQQLASSGGPRAASMPPQQGTASQQSTSAQHGPYSGVGPQNYVRSDMRIHEEIHERMTAHGHLDASGLTISVEHGVVTLNGIVPDRAQKHLAEDIADSVPGVKDVVNHLSTQPQRFALSTRLTGSIRLGATPPGLADLL